MKTLSAGSGIGTLQIGKSAVEGSSVKGETVESTIISQYANSPTLVQLILSFNDYLDPAADFDAFYNLIWDIDTAQGIGLDIWGRIVGVDRVLTLTSQDITFGFQDGASDMTPFNEAPFFADNPSTYNFALSDAVYRTLILIKALANISEVAAPVLNKMLGQFFSGRGRAYVNTVGPMMMRYTFEFYLEPAEAAILANSGVFPAPTGVQVFFIQQPPGSTFGFSEAGTRDALPFGEGTFFADIGLASVPGQSSAAEAALGEFVLGLNTL